MTALRFCPSTSSLRRVLCAVLEPNSTPSGTMTAARPPGLSRRKKRARKSNSVFLVFTTCCRSLAQFSYSSRAGKGRVSQDEGVFLVFASVILGE